ncbi:MAG: pyridoxal-phosphate dependent enzyme, partial [Victivallales bacterium]|nr:pyridoxal-phosphate dependent enzyme [Victivallales bacterium]
MSICKTILEAVGNTPLVELQNLPSADDARILVKVEAVNVGGSIKTRTALNMIEAAEKEGLIHKGSVIIEP